MKAIEKGIGRIQKLAYQNTKVVLIDTALRPILNTVVREAFKEVINADRKP